MVEQQKWMGAASRLRRVARYLRSFPCQTRLCQHAIVEAEPGRETRVRHKAIGHLSKYVARDAGAVDPRITLRTRRGRYDIRCSFGAREFVHLPGLSLNVQEKMRAALAEQGMKVGKVEVTVQEPAPSEAERVRAL